MLNLRETFGNNFRRIAKERGLRQIDIAISLGVTTSVVSEWANGTKFPRAEQLEKLTDFLNIPISDLLSPSGMSHVLLLDDEKRLIDQFRLLPDSRKHIVLATAKLLVSEMLKMK